MSERTPDLKTLVAKAQCGRINIPLTFKVKHEAHMQLLEYVLYLKRNNRFAETARRALRLVWALDEGNTQELEKQYPMITAALRDGSEPSSDLDELKQIIQEQGQRIEQLVNSIEGEQIPLGPLVGAPLPGLKPSHRDSLRSLAGAVEIPMPDFEALADDEDTIIMRRDTSAGDLAMENFMRAAGGLQP